MIEFILVVEALAAIVLVFAVYQVRKHYIASLKAHQKRQARKSTSIKISPRNVLAEGSVNELMPSVEESSHVNPSVNVSMGQPEYLVEETPVAQADVQEEPAAQETTPAEINSTEAEISSVSDDRCVLGSYIGDFFAESEKPHITEDSLQSMRNLAAVNDSAALATVSKLKV